MTFQQMKYIMKVAQCGSIAEAARQLFIAQPSLSAAVKEVENEYGIEIFYRNKKGIVLTEAGVEFLSYLKQINEQMELMDDRYSKAKERKKLCAISTQHYAFAVNAFSELVKKLDTDQYEFTLRETRTYEIIEDVANFRSDLGIIYLSDFNEKVIKKLLKDNQLTFVPLFVAMPHVFISCKHPLANKAIIRLEELEPYPFLAFEQGVNNSFYFSEELCSTWEFKKKINVSDRATLFNLLIGANGYTICSGVLNSDLNGNDIKAVRLDVNENMCIGYIKNESAFLSGMAKEYIEELKKIIVDNGYSLEL